MQTLGPPMQTPAPERDRELPLNGTPSQAPNDTPSGVPIDTPDDVPEDIPKDVPNDRASDIPNVTPTLDGEEGRDGFNARPLSPNPPTESTSSGTPASTRKPNEDLPFTNDAGADVRPSKTASLGGGLLGEDPEALPKASQDPDPPEPADIGKADPPSVELPEEGPQGALPTVSQAPPTRTSSRINTAVSETVGSFDGPANALPVVPSAGAAQDGKDEDLANTNVEAPSPITTSSMSFVATPTFTELKTTVPKEAAPTPPPSPPKEENQPLPEESKAEPTTSTKSTKYV